MKFFLDENFPRLALAQLQGAGHSAIHALTQAVWLVTDTRIYSRQRE